MRTRSLTSLDMTNNKISGNGGFAISLVIKENTMIRIIKLAMNKIDDANGAKILRALNKNDMLEELDLSSNDLEMMVKKINFINSKLNFYFFYLFKGLSKPKFSFQTQQKFKSS